MIYKQYTSKILSQNYLPARGEIVQMSVQSRPGTYLRISESLEDKITNTDFLIGEVGILEWDNISLANHLINDKNIMQNLRDVEIDDKNIKIKILVLDKEKNIFPNALIDILYNTSKEEDLNFES